MSSPPLSAFARRVRRAIRAHHLVRRGERVLVAVSGGPDSASLLGALSELAARADLTLVAAHAHHGLRGEDSDLDSRCAEELCERLGVRLRTGRCDVAKGPGLEARARAVRYAFLESVATEEGCHWIATGHTRDDQAETVLLRLLRGAALTGLAGIPVRRGRVIRPLLECSRSQTTAYVAARGLPSRHDVSNDDRRFTRNRVRHDLLPVLRAIEPAATTVLARSATLAAIDARVARAAYRDALARIVTESGSLSVPAVRSLAPLLRAGAVRAWLEGRLGSLVDVEHHHVEAVVHCVMRARPSAVVRLGDGLRLRRTYDVLDLDSDEPASLAVRDVVAIGAAGLYTIGEWCFDVDVVDRPSRGSLGDPWTYHADPAASAGAAILRPARRGDRIAPFGLGHTRKLQDVFVDRRVPRWARWGRPVLELDGELAWVPGVVRGRQWPVAATSPRVWRLRTLPAADGFRLD